MSDQINNDPLKDYVDEFLERTKLVILGDHLEDPDNELKPALKPRVHILMPRQHGRQTTSKFLNVFTDKEITDDNVGRPSDRP